MEKGGVGGGGGRTCCCSSSGAADFTTAECAFSLPVVGFQFQGNTCSRAGLHTAW